MSTVICPDCGAFRAHEPAACPGCRGHWAHPAEFRRSLDLAVPLDAVRTAFRDAAPASAEEAEIAGPNRAEWIGLVGMWGLDPATLLAAQRAIEATEEFQLAADCPSGTWTTADYDRWWGGRAAAIVAPAELRSLATMLLGYWYARKRRQCRDTCGPRLDSLRVAPPVAEALVTCAAWLDALEATQDVLTTAFAAYGAAHADAPEPGRAPR